MGYIRRAISTPVPQSKPLRADQVPNSAGGYAWAVDKWVQLQRWLILGSEKGTYYIGEVDLTMRNLAFVEACIAENPMRVVDETEAVIKLRKAAKLDSALYTLAMCMKLPKGTEAADHARRSAQQLVPYLHLTGTQVMKLVEFLDMVGGSAGWGRGTKNAIGHWFDAGLNKDVRHLAYEAVKYQHREGWSLRDLLRLAHPVPESDERKAVYKWITSGEYADFGRIVPELDPIWGYREIRTTDPDTGKMGYPAQVIRKFRLPREAVPSELLGKAEVWDALVDDMPMVALVRNLATLTRLEVIKPLGGRTTDIYKKLIDPENVKRSRIHPIQVLSAIVTYGAGRGMRSKHTWTPNQTIVDGLDSAFYASFANVEPSGKNVLLALDVSGSMGHAVNGIENLDCRTASGALALVTANAEPSTYICAFASGDGSRPTSVLDRGFDHPQMVPLAISPRSRLADVVKQITGLPFGGTDCALPMLHALDLKLDVDAFVIYTDSESWAGKVHPAEALEMYRKRMNKPDAKLIVVAMAANEYSVGDPNDPNTLNVCGFDPTVPAVVSNFIGGMGPVGPTLPPKSPSEPVGEPATEDGVEDVYDVDRL